MPAPTLTVRLEDDEVVEYGNDPVDTGLFFDVSAGQAYIFRFLVAYRTTDIYVAIRLGLTYPSATTIAATVSGNPWLGPIPLEDPTVARPDRLAALASNVDHLAIIEGIIEPTDDGVLRLQYAPETTGAIVTVRRGSAGILERM